ncbi:WD repeat-containing protein 43 isoform X2 [Plutella xylostella]|uniref:WD repeat-containing protein 43 isoform X1 n=1 Tax=Plutella xylostella TaxID=51655 RepID=UPI002032DA61|nr:WD repeat-containing protein 43 isoform X1 [Plutella xylostella]XP_048488295.1 WD repeat-containing protein 43 isoform X2 [Plutella xylostella]
MAEIAFSDDGKYFSAISHDGRLRIWDTETSILKQEYTPDLHLSSPPSCLQWILISNTDTPRKGGKKRSNSISEQQDQCVALGTTNGKILIYSVSQAKVLTVLEDGKNSEVQKCGVTSLDWHKNYGLFSSNKAGYVQEWNIGSGEISNKYNVIFDSKNKQASHVSAIKIVPHNQKTPATFLVTASWQVRLWRLLDGTVDLVRTMGHSGSARPLLTVARGSDKCWLIEGSQNERLLSFWDVTITPQNLPQVNGSASPTKKQRKKSTSDAVVPHPTYNFVLEDAPKMVDVNLSQTDEGVKLNMLATTRSGVMHYYGHMLNGASTKPLKPSVTVQVTTEAARMLPAQCCKYRDDACLLGYEANEAMVFETVVPDTKTKTQVLIRSDNKRPKPDTPRERSDSVTELVTYAEPVSRKRVTAGGQLEVAMEARLANLALDTKSRSKSAVNQNLTKLLVQGLHSKDKKLIQMVLTNADPATAARTTAALPPDQLPALLQQLAGLAARRSTLCSRVCVWLHALILTQSSLLLASLSSPVGDQLAQLLAIFTQRRSNLCQLLNLKGRLELAATQRARPAAAAEAEAVLVYNDSSSDEEDMAVERADSDGGSWDDSDEDDE